MRRRSRSRRARSLRLSPFVLTAALAAAGLGGVPAVPLPAGQARAAEPAQPAAATRTVLVPFETAPFPYRGTPPGQKKPFLDVERGGRKGHTARGGQVYFEDKTYSDRRVLITIPRGFDPSRPALIVVYLHGNDIVLERDVRDRQRIPRQLVESGLNAVLVAPQFAVDAADSSPGAFWEPGHFARFLDEAAAQVGTLLGGGRAARELQRAAVLLVAHGGGCLAAAHALDGGGAGGRIHGVILMDALYAEEERFAAFLKTRPKAFFFSAYSTGSDERNARLVKLLADAGIIGGTGLPARFNPGEIAFLFAGRDASPRDFMTRAWVSDPLKSVLGRIAGFERPQPARTASPADPGLPPLPAVPDAPAPAERAPQWVPTMNHDQFQDFVDRFGRLAPAPAAR